MKPEAQCHLEGVVVYAAGGWSEGRAFYPGRSAALPRLGTGGVLPAPQGAGWSRRGQQRSWQSATPVDEGPKEQCRERAELSMATGAAGDGSEMTRARRDGRGRKPREPHTGASNATAGPSFIRPEAEMRLLGVILGRDNRMAELRRVVANKGALGVDGMSVDDLSRHLKAQWPRIKEDLLAGRYRPSCRAWG